MMQHWDEFWFSFYRIMTFARFRKPVPSEEAHLALRTTARLYLYGDSGLLAVVALAEMSQGRNGTTVIFRDLPHFRKISRE